MAPTSKWPVRASLVLVLLVTGCLLRGGAMATYHPGGPGAGLGGELTGTAGLGTRLATTGGASFGATTSAGYDGGVGALVAGWGPSIGYATAGDRWSFATMLTCGARLFAKRDSRGTVLGTAMCELRVGPSYLAEVGNKDGSWIDTQLVIRYAAFGTNDETDGWTIGLAGTWDHWLLDRSPRWKPQPGEPAD